MMPIAHPFIALSSNRNIDHLLLCPLPESFAVLCHKFCRKYYNREVTLPCSKKCVTLQEKKPEQALMERVKDHGKTSGWHWTPHILSPVKTFQRGTGTAG